MHQSHANDYYYNLDLYDTDSSHPILSSQCVGNNTIRISVQYALDSVVLPIERVCGRSTQLARPLVTNLVQTIILQWILHSTVPFAVHVLRRVEPWYR
jgi:hypothetical protein